MAGLVAILALFFDNGILARVWAVMTHRYKWETKPVRDARGAIRARVSHGHPDSRYLTLAIVVCPQRLAVRLLRRLRGDKLPRWIVAAVLFQGACELKQNQGQNLEGQLAGTVPLPTWKFWKPLRSQDPAERRLLLLVRFDRRTRTMVETVREVPGSLDPIGGGQR